MRALPVLLLVACGAPSAPPPAARVVPAMPPSAPGDVEVARVNGRPVWGSCVTAQARGLAGGEADRKRAAYDQCVAFELLAQAAEHRGLADAPEVGEALRAAEVNRLVELDFDHRYNTPADLGPSAEPVIAKNLWRMHLIQLRASTFARFVVPEHAAPEVDAQARALAEQLAGPLRSQTGLFPIHLREAADQVPRPDAIKLEVSDVKPTYRGDLVDEYASALYAIPEIGRIAGPIRTKWGWDVVLWTGGVEAQDRSREDIVAELFPELRRRYFQVWVSQIAKQLGVHIDIDQAAVAALDQEGP
jgi:hypothetical protein